MGKLSISLIVMDDFAHLIQALRSIDTNIPHKIYVVINTKRGRNDPQIDHLLEEFPEVDLIINTNPRGFAANHNQVMQISQSDYIALLNDDIQLRPQALSILVDYLDTHPQVGIVGGRLYNPDGSDQVSAYSDPSLLRMAYKISGLARLTAGNHPIRRWLRKHQISNLVGIESLKAPITRPVDILKGVAMVVRRTAYEQVGLMDETTIAYGEEPDWHLRFRQAGWGVHFVAEAGVIHYGQGQAQLKLKGKLLLEDRRSILNYYLKHRPKWQVSVIRSLLVLSGIWWGLLWLPLDKNRAKTHFQIAHLGIFWQRPISA